jgi:hypothetical protein
VGKAVWDLLMYNDSMIVQKSIVVYVVEHFLGTDDGQGIYEHRLFYEIGR